MGYTPATQILVQKRKRVNYLTGAFMNISLVFILAAAVLSVTAVVLRLGGLGAYRYCKGLPVAALVLMFAYRFLVFGVDPVLFWVALALVFSFAGDIFLIDPDKYLIFGMIAFGVAHVFYVLAFLHGGFRFTAGGVGILAVAAVFLGLLRFLTWRSRKGVLFFPFVAYTLFLAGMNIAAQSHELLSGGPGLLTLGALLFYASDAVLAWDLMIQSGPRKQALMLTLYYAAQILIAWRMIDRAGIIIQ